MLKKGFTLIECLVAISILMIGVLSAFALVTRSLSTAPLIADNFSASLYSQQGIEAVIKLRNDNWRQYKSWDSGLLDTSELSRTFCIIIDGNGFVSTPPPSDASGCQIGTTKFSRLVTIERSEGDRLKVTCEVSWQTKGKEYKVSTTTYLYNWANPFFPSS